jgi:hypothetical protein
MTAVSLFDALSGDGTGASPAGPSNGRMEQLAARLVESSLADWHRVRKYEADFSPTCVDDLKLVLEIDRSIHSLYLQWVAEAEEVYARGRQLIAAGHPVPQIDELDDAIGRGRARLLATPERFIRALEQVERGEAIPARELRDELDARLRAGR